MKYIIVLLVFLSLACSKNERIVPEKLPCRIVESRDSGSFASTTKFRYDNSNRLVTIEFLNGVETTGKVEYQYGPGRLKIIWFNADGTLSDKLNVDFKLDNKGKAIRHIFTIISQDLNNLNSFDTSYYSYNGQEQLESIDQRIVFRKTSNNQVYSSSFYKRKAQYASGRISVIDNESSFTDSNGVTNSNSSRLVFYYDESSPKVEYVPFNDFGNNGPFTHLGNLIADKVPVKISQFLEGDTTKSSDTEFFTSYDAKNNPIKITQKSKDPFSGFDIFTTRFLTFFCP